MALLKIWGGEWSLPSIDITCLELMTLTNFGKFPVKFEPTSATLWSKPGTELPSLVEEEDVYNGREEILAYFINKGYTVDDWLTDVQRSDLTAMKSLIKRNLHPYVAYMLWMNSHNYTTVTRKAYSKLCSFPANYIIPNGIHKTTKDLLHVMKQMDEDDDVAGDKLYADAAQCLNLFSTFLDNKPFLFGDRPSSLDAMLFAYIALLEKVPLQSDKLQNHLAACDNLGKFVGRITQQYFKPGSDSGSVNDNKPPSQEKEEWNKDWLIPSVVAVTAMLSYAAHIGLLHFRGTS